MIKKILLFLPIFAFADKLILAPQPEEKIPAPWLTGPLLTASAVTIDVGHYNIEPYLYAYAFPGVYNEDWKVVKAPSTLWDILFQPSFEFGLTHWLDLEIDPYFFYNTNDGVSSWEFGDLLVTLNMQLFKSSKDVAPWVTSLKFFCYETFPTGKFQKLNPKKKFTEAVGHGSWQSTFGLVWGNLVHLSGFQFFNSRLSAYYTYAAPLHVKGFNAYGGGYGTDGKITLGYDFEIDFGLEYAFTRNWVLALDMVNIWLGPVQFKGKNGVTATGAPARNEIGSSYQLSFAPAFEYNWSQNLGLVAGVWFTAAGRNAAKFTSGVIALNIYR